MIPAEVQKGVKVIHHVNGVGVIDSDEITEHCHTGAFIISAITPDGDLHFWFLSRCRVV